MRPVFVRLETQWLSNARMSESLVVFNKKQNLRCSDGSIVVAVTNAQEFDNPYMISLTTTLLNGLKVQTEIGKDDLSIQLRKWLQGKVISSSCVAVPRRIEEAIMQFVKIGKPPSQEYLIYWILSRCELALGAQAQLLFGGADQQDDENGPLQNLLPNTVNAAMDTQRMNNYTFQMDQGTVLSERTVARSATQRPQSAGPGHGRTQLNSSYELSRKLLGKSVALSALKSSTVKGRTDAKQAVKMTSAQLILGADIAKARKDVEAAIEARRRAIEVAQVRHRQKAEKFNKIHDKIKSSHDDNTWSAQATQELLNLHQMTDDIHEDIARQRVLAHREAQLVAWTKAPAAFVNRRGKSERGPVLGDGPLPATTTTSFKDPRILCTTRHFYWDTAGRRHMRTAETDVLDAQDESLVSQCLRVMRQAASGAAEYGMDLKQVFLDMDSSGDGCLSKQEFNEAMKQLGVMLSGEALTALYSHFDPNGDGHVRYGEFVWAFFNRRAFARQWRRSTSALTSAQVTARFHAADTSGDGQLSPREFEKFLASVGMKMSRQEVVLLMDRFDSDGNGSINLPEFRCFVEAEMKALLGANAATASPPAQQHNTHSHSTSHSHSPGHIHAVPSRPPPRPHSSTGNNKHSATAQRESGREREMQSEASVEGKHQQEQSPSHSSLPAGHRAQDRLSHTLSAPHTTTHAQLPAEVEEQEQASHSKSQAQAQQHHPQQQWLNQTAPAVVFKFSSSALATDSGR